MMLLKSLDRLYDDLVAADRLLPSGFAKKPVRYFIDLGGLGELLGATDVGDRGEPYIVPELGRPGVSPKAFVGSDKVQYVLGLPGKSEDEAKAVACQLCFLDRLQEAAQAIAQLDGPASRGLSVIRTFLLDRSEAIAALTERGLTFEFDAKGEMKAASARVAFRVDGVDPTSSPALRSWWSEIVDADLGSGRARRVPGERPVR